MPSGRCGFLVLLLAASTSPGIARADPETTRPEPRTNTPRERARVLGYSGLQAYQAADFDTAYAKLNQAYALLEVPSLGLWSARALIKLGRWIEARERLRRVAILPIDEGKRDVQRKAQSEARRELSLLEARLPVVRFQSPGVPVLDALELNGVALSPMPTGAGHAVDPGRHRAVAERRGQRVAVNFEIAEKEARIVVLDFKEPGMTTRAGAAASGASPFDPSSAAWIGMGGAAVGLVFGATTGLLALGKKNSLEDAKQCRSGLCDPSARKEVEDYNLLLKLSSVGFVAGGVLAATGIVLFSIPSNPEAGPNSATHQSTLRLELGPAGVTVRGVYR